MKSLFLYPSLPPPPSSLSPSSPIWVTHSTKEQRAPELKPGRPLHHLENTVLNLLLPTFHLQLSPLLQPPAHSSLPSQGLQRPLGYVGGSRGSPTFPVL